jgi:hypothetical protein
MAFRQAAAWQPERWVERVGSRSGPPCRAAHRRHTEYAVPGLVTARTNWFLCEEACQGVGKEGDTTYKDTYLSNYHLRSGVQIRCCVREGVKEGTRRLVAARMKWSLCVVPERNSVVPVRRTVFCCSLFCVIKR